MTGFIPEHRAPTITSMRRPTSLRALLLQVRDAAAPAQHERLCFLERLRLPPEQLVSVNVVTDRLPSLDEVRAFDLVFLGGAGRHSACDHEHFTDALEQLVRDLVRVGVPFFGSCYGHQFLVRALGGRVIHDQSREEVGTFEIELTADGTSDPLLLGLPRRFDVHLGHHDRVVDLPPNIVPLAHSARCPNQLIRVVDKPVYGSQFHSEMTLQHIRERLLMYADEYLEDDGESLSSLLRATSYADGLLRRFLDLCLEQRASQAVRSTPEPVVSLPSPP